MTSEVKFPKISVQLSGQDGNIYSITGRVLAMMRRAGISSEERDEFFKEVHAQKDYDAALRVIMKWVDVE